MNRLNALFAITIAVGISFATAGNPHEDGERVRVLSVQDIQERLDGNQSKATMVEVTIGPGESGLSHRHPGPGFVYVLEGEYELGIDDKPTKLYQAGETFYEPTGCLHRVSRNPSATGQTRLIAVVLHPHNVNEIAVPVESHE